jgi:hypothetical protein
LTQDWNCSVEFAAPGVASAAVFFQSGAVSVRPSANLKTAISLFFVSTRQLVRQFTGRGFSLPLPRRGFWRLAQLHRFNQLGKILESELERHARLLLSVALGSIGPLAQRDSRARDLLGDCPEGIAEFGVPSADLYGWVEITRHKISWGRGRALRTPEVKVFFRNEPIALAALRGELDEFAAIGKGDLRVSGLVPLADTLGAVMARADVYLERRSQ